MSAVLRLAVVFLLLMSPIAAHAEKRAPIAAHAEKRVALVIGNSAYEYTGELSNPANDAGDIAAALRNVGFDVVEGRNLDKPGMDRIIRQFARKLHGADVGLLFYAGHGLQVGGQNYLVPVDAKLEDASGLDFETVRLDVLHRAMEREAKTNVIFLDACRDNPLGRNLARAMGTRSGEIAQGLAAVESGVGTLISFSTQPGNVALDGRGRNSPYSEALFRQISDSKEDLSTLLINVRNAVMAATNDRQIPWEHSALRAKFYFTPPKPEAIKPPSNVPVPPSRGAARSSEAVEAWSATKETTNITALELFIDRYPDTYFADLAKLRIEELKKQRAAAVAAPPSPPPAPAKQLPITSEGASQKGESGRTGDQVELKFWGTIKNSDKAADFQAYLDLYPEGQFATLARTRLKQLAMAETERAASAAAQVATRKLAGDSQAPAMRDCPECPEMILIPPGPFEMGSNEMFAFERPVHQVLIGKPFYIGRREVTFQEWDACLSEGGCNYRPDDRRLGRGMRPVTDVDWNDARGYAAWLSRKTGQIYRLPSESEWEYAARAGTTTTYPWGKTVEKDRANCLGCTTEPLKNTVDTGSYPPNAFGLFDMVGNAAEWVEDCWNDSYRGAPTDGSAWTRPQCRERVVRGGAFNNDARYLRSAARFKYDFDVRYYAYGFRVVREK
jgi:formylglycine-generating enzyme required for sulfatase activity/uncharacterized caspase-like protein